MWIDLNILVEYKIWKILFKWPIKHLYQLCSSFVFVLSLFYYRQKPAQCLHLFALNLKVERHMKQFMILLFLVSSIMLFYSCQSVQKVACVGDSITEGDGLKDRANEAYPAILSKELGKKYRVLNFGQSGATLLKKGDRPYWEKVAFKNVLTYEPDVIIIQLGTNDSRLQNILSHPGEFVNDLRAMVDSFQSLPSRPRIYLCKPVPSIENRYQIIDSVLVADVIPAIDQVAIERKCDVIDLYGAFVNKMNLFPDGVHPNKEGAMQVAEIIARSINK